MRTLWGPCDAILFSQILLTQANPIFFTLLRTSNTATCSRCMERCNGEQVRYTVMLCCPVCKSTEIYLVSGGYTGMIYRCKKCGFEGSFVIDSCGEENDNREH